MVGEEGYVKGGRVRSSGEWGGDISVKRKGERKSTEGERRKVGRKREGVREE